jgi:protein involved in polysaccharide export with SLBB domain
MACLVIAGLVRPSPAWSQDVPADLLERLSPEQKAAALDRLGGQGGAVSEAPLSEPALVNPASDSMPAPPAEPSPIERLFAAATAVPSLRTVQGVRAMDEPLKQYGYDVFTGSPTTFAPATDIPVPPDFVVGPGDTIELQLFGKENSSHSLVVSREGLLHLPGIGPVPVAGQRFDELRRNLERIVADRMIGMKASVTLGPLRSIRVFILGDVNRPGSYTVSSLSTMTNALFVSGGIKPIGSLRDIQLKRSGKVITHLDLYDLLLRGDTSGDARLQPGDVIFVPPIGLTVAAAGEVRRPAIYELSNERTLRDLVGMAGGLLSTAYARASQLERISQQGDRTLIDVDLTQEPALKTTLTDGDVLRVYSTLERMDDIVLVTGHVLRPGGHEWHADMRLSDLIPSVQALLPKPDLEYALVRREVGAERKVEAFSVRLGRAIAQPGSEDDVTLEPRDQVVVFGLEDSAERSALVKPLIDELKLQASAAEQARIVSVTGLVRGPGQYPLQKGMRVSDAIRAGADLREAAYTLTAEVTRYQIVGGKRREIGHIPIDLAAVLAGDADADITLEPYDQLNIKQLPQWTEQMAVEIRGEVRFPGTYPIKRGETLSELLERAGGLTDFAYPQGAVFSREELRRKEQEQIEALTGKLEADIAAISLEQMAADRDKQQAFAASKSLVDELKTAKAVGRLVIDLPGVIEGDPKADVVLKDQDKIYIPQKTQEVTVIGEVQYPTSHMVTGKLSRDDYIRLSGGTTTRADAKRTYIVRANGSVEAGRGGLFFSHGDERVFPGDTIVVPLDAERLRPLTYWTSISQIVYQIGVAAAAWKTVGVL